jgi:hypothetical protein
MKERICYRVVDVADHFIQARYFGTKTVEFRIGSELRALNFLLSGVRDLRRALNVPVSWLIAVGRVLIHVAAPFGSSSGGVIVEITGYAGEELQSETWSVFSDDRGERIPSIPAAVAAKMILQRNWDRTFAGLDCAGSANC